MKFHITKSRAVQGVELNLIIKINYYEVIKKITKYSQLLFTNLENQKTLNFC